MRVGILTFSNASNRGAIMQCYALASKIREFGHHPIVISIELPVGKKSLKGKIMSFFNSVVMGSFRKKYYPNTTKTYRSAETLVSDPPPLDAVVVGSDQVWNRNLVSRFGTEAFFLSFADEDCRKLSYAASLGEDRWDNPTADILKLIKRFNCISVREDDAVDIVERNLCFQNVKSVLDPVFLLDSYDNLLGSAKKRQEEIVLGMFFFLSQDSRDILCDINKSLGQEIQIIGSKPSGDIFDNHPIVGVKRWLRMIRSSRFVVTNSFHCMAFSIIFHRNFIVVPPYPGRESRMLSLLNKLGLGERYVKDFHDYIARKDELLGHNINYEIVNKKLTELRKESVLFLKNALS